MMRISRIYFWPLKKKNMWRWKFSGTPKWQYPVTRNNQSPLAGPTAFERMQCQVYIYGNQWISVEVDKPPRGPAGANLEFAFKQKYCSCVLVAIFTNASRESFLALLFKVRIYCGWETPGGFLWSLLSVAPLMRYTMPHKPFSIYIPHIVDSFFFFFSFSLRFSQIYLNAILMLLKYRL